MVNSFAESADLQRTGAMSPSTCAVLPERLRLDHRGGPWQQQSRPHLWPRGLGGRCPPDMGGDRVRSPSDGPHCA